MSGDTKEKMAEFDYEELVKATDDFNPTRLIGKGKITVWLLHVKKPSQGLQSLHENSYKLENEIRVLSSLRAIPHVLKLPGTSYDSFNNKLIVIEHMPNGSMIMGMENCFIERVRFPIWTSVLKEEADREY